jgi:excisionase family DNA binding protein
MALEVKPEALYGVKAMSEFFGVNERTIQRWAREGRLPAFKVRGGRRWFCYGRDLLALDKAGGVAWRQGSLNEA